MYDLRFTINEEIGKNDGEEMKFKNVEFINDKLLSDLIEEVCIHVSFAIEFPTMNSIEANAVAEFERTDFRQEGLHMLNPFYYIEALQGDPNLQDAKRVAELLEDAVGRKPFQIVHMLYVQHYPIDQVREAMTALQYHVLQFEDVIDNNGTQIRIPSLAILDPENPYTEHQTLNVTIVTWTRRFPLKQPRH
jgi:hypothetical protein